jgi:GAF domain-containing protein
MLRWSGMHEHGAGRCPGCPAALTTKALTWVLCCSVVGVRDPTSFVLLAAHGRGSAELEANPVMRGAAWSPVKLLGSQQYLLCSPQSAAEAAALPRDWHALHAARLAASFLAVPIVNGSSCVGVLTVTSTEQQAFDVAR